MLQEIVSGIQVFAGQWTERVPGYALEVAIPDMHSYSVIVLFISKYIRVKKY